MKQTILIVEDDITFGTMLQNWFRRNNFESRLCSTVADAKVELMERAPNLVLSDLRLPDGDGILFLQWIRESKLNVPVILMTGYAEIQSAVAAIKFGAEDYLEKPINPSILKEKVEAALATRETPVAQQSKPTPRLKHKNNVVMGQSEAARHMYDHLLRVAPTRMDVLLLGESGTGKEYAAQMIHDNSSRSEKPFIAVDCGSLSRELAPSELFGHLKGSFTSAVSDKTGVFVQASGGTLFLDEVGNLSYEVQVQLLRALQERKVRPVGSAKDQTVDVRIITATNENLETAIAEGRFREDLYHRLNEFSIAIPPLRQRKGDLPLFAQEFLRQANEELNRELKGFTAEALEILEKQYWSGNLRELRNVVRRTALFANGQNITADDLPTFAPQTIEEKENMALYPGNEREQIETALHKARGNKTIAAQLLHIDRKTLYNKMHALGIEL